MNLERIDEIIAKNITITDKRLYEGVFNAVLEAVNEENEACAKLCEEKKSKYEERASKPDNARDIDPEVARIAKMTCDFNAAAIRARGEV